MAVGDAALCTGVVLLREMKRINGIYRMADENPRRFGIKYFDRNANPEVFCSEDGQEERCFNWERGYDGSRVVLNWME